MSGDPTAARASVAYVATRRLLFRVHGERASGPPARQLIRSATMADWRKLALSALLADGKIDDTEVKILRKELYADGRISTDEFRFLAELRNEAQKKARSKGRKVSPTFEKFFFKAVEDKVLDNGRISEGEVRLLKDMICADGKIDANEIKLLRILNRKARSVHPTFTKFYEEAVAQKSKVRK
jgi:hypothetical protein